MADTEQTKLNVLVADDTAGLRDTLTRYLESQGHTVTVAETGNDAIHLIQNRYFDVIVTDILMPGADGIEVITETKKRYPTTRLIAMTGGGDMLDANLCIRLAAGIGAHATLLKPFTIPQFAAALAKAVPAQSTS